MTNPLRNKSGFVSGRVLIGLALIALALAAVLYFTMRETPEAKQEAAEAAYQVANPPYVPPPPPPVISVPPEVAGPQFDYNAGPREVRRRRTSSRRRSRG